MEEGRRFLFDDPFMRDIASVFTDHFNDSVVKEVLLQSVPNLVAFLSVLSAGDEAEQQLAVQAAVLLHATITEEATKLRSERKATSVIRRFLDATTQRNQSTDSLARNLSALVSRLGAEKVRNTDVFASIRGTTAEFVAYSRFLISRAPTEVDAKQSFTAMQVLYELASQHLGDSNAHQVHVLHLLKATSGLLSDDNYRSIHLLVAETLEAFVRRTLEFCEKSKPLRDQLKIACKALLSSCMSSHESYQMMFFTHCTQAQQLSLKRRTRSVGLMQLAKSDDVSGWNVANRQSVEAFGSLSSSFVDYGTHVPSEIVGCLVATFRVVRVVVDGTEVIGLDERDFIGALPPYKTAKEERRLLSHLNPSFCAQTLIEERLDVTYHSQTRLSRPPSLLIPLFASAPSSKAMNLDSDDARVLRAELAASSRFLRRRRDQPTNDINHDACQGVVRNLARLCSSRSADEVSIEATYCLGDIWYLMRRSGNVAALSTFSVHSSENPCAGQQLEWRLRANFINALSECIRNSFPKHALIAVESLKSVLSISELGSCLGYVDDAEIRRALMNPGNFVNQVSRSSELRLTVNERLMLFEKACLLAGERLDPDEDWCWSLPLWKSAAEASTPFDEWIRCIVPGILVTVYSRVVKGKPTIFESCQRVCTIESRVAAAVFPAVLFELLQLPEEDLEPSSGLDSVQLDTFVGHNDSAQNKKISRCFEVLICGFSSRPETDRRGSLMALELVLDTLNHFCHITTRRFTESVHHAKVRTLKPQQKSSESQEMSTTRQPRASRQGVPYGTILRLSGLLVAEACIQVERPASAAYYLDLYGDARFGGSTRALRVLDSLDRKETKFGSWLTWSTSDISGFSVTPVSESSHDDVEIHFDECIRYLKLFYTSLKKLGDVDSANAAVKLKEGLLASCGLFQSSFVQSRVPALSTLQYLNNEGNVTSFGSPHVVLETVASLEGLDLPSTAQSFIAGSVAEEGLVTGMTPAEKRSLRESWFNCALNRMRWGDEVFCLDTITPPGGVRGVEAGFNELVVESLASVTRDDYDLSLCQIRTSRKLLARELSALSNPETQVYGLTECLNRLCALNDLEVVASVNGSAAETLAVFAVPKVEEEEDALNYSDFGQTLAEISLRAVSSKVKREGSERDALVIHDELIAHLWNVCTSACSSGRHATAIGALDRLRALYRADHPESLFISLKLRLQEATILESQGDFAGALRRSTQVVKRLQEGPSSLDRNVLLCEALIASGRWMAKHKASPARTILETYMKPGASYALSVYESKPSRRSALRASAGLLELAQLSSNLFDTVSERVESREWRRAGRILVERETELHSCRVLVVSLQKEMSRLKKNSKQIDDFARKIHENSIYCTQLERQVVNARCERMKIEGSVNEYRLLTLQSITQALSVADISRSDDYSRYIYRMVSLWFLADSADDKIQASMRDAVEKIPSFRFVPLASQLFSRLGQGSKTFIYPTLRDLIFKMCRDHPYHCFVQILSLSNGLVVGEGVGGRGRSDFLENTSSSKVEVARELIKSLKETSEEACSLVESYQLLTDAYIHLALASVGDCPRGSKLTFAKVGKVAAQRLDQCLPRQDSDRAPCILTKPPPIRPRCDYNEPGGGVIGTERVRSPLDSARAYGFSTLLDLHSLLARVGCWL
jgi:hypothetical protein